MWIFQWKKASGWIIAGLTSTFDTNCLCRYHSISFSCMACKCHCPKLLLKLQILKIAYVAIMLMVSKMFRGLTSEWNAIHKHDTIVIKMRINKCCTGLFELYWTDTFQREVKHCNGSYESRKNKIIHININWWIRNIRSNHRISEFKCDLNSNRFSSKPCIAFRILVILYTIGLYVYFIP